MIVNSSNTYTYDAFGNQTNDIDNDTNPFRYNGEYFDNETGYIYLRARYYDPSIGHFTTEDPVKDGLNWYVYCSNNPVMFVDPSGMKLKGKSQELTEQFLGCIKDITKDNGFYITDDGYIEWKDLGGVQEGGSETAASLFKSIIGLENNTCYISTDEKRKFTYGSGNILTGITIGLDGLLDNNELYAALIHESTHYLTEALGFPNQVVYLFKTDNIDIQNKAKGYVGRKYMEALAMTVEEHCRKEMGIRSRSDVTDLLIGSNSYGQFPNILTSDPEATFNGLDEKNPLLGKRVGDYIRGYTLKSRGSQIIEYISILGNKYKGE